MNGSATDGMQVVKNSKLEDKKLKKEKKSKDKKEKKSKDKKEKKSKDKKAEKRSATGDAGESLVCKVAGNVSELGVLVDSRKRTKVENGGSMNGTSEIKRIRTRSFDAAEKAASETDAVCCVCLVPQAKVCSDALCRRETRRSPPSTSIPPSQQDFLQGESPISSPSRPRPSSPLFLVWMSSAVPARVWERPSPFVSQ